MISDFKFIAKSARSAGEIFFKLVIVTHTHTYIHNCFTALWILSGTTRMNWYQKKHSPAHTYMVICHPISASSALTPISTLVHPVPVTGIKQPLQINVFITLYMLPFITIHFQ